MMTELFRLYFSLAGEAVTPVPPPPTSTYRDFIAREREALSSEEHRRFWEEKLSERSVLTLPHRAPSGLEADARQAKLSIAIAPELSASLKRLASSAGVPLKSVLLAAHLRVLSVLGNQPEVLTGLVSNGRLEEPDGERVLGLFLNTVPLRCRLRGGSWLELIRETFRAEQELMPFRRYPLAALQRKAGGMPLFETVFNFTHFHVYQGLREIPRVEILGAQSVAQTNYALVADFSVDPLTSEVTMRLEFNTASLSADYVETIGGYYLRALEAMAGESEEDYASRSLLSATERRQLLSTWNDTRRDYPKGATVHGLFEEQAARTPDAEVVCFRGESISYAELAARADQFARRLRRLGVGPESRVGVLMNRSTNLIAALLSVLKAGGAYVPLDPAYPAERLRYMLEDAGASVLLTEGSLAEVLGESSVHVVDLGPEYEEFDDRVAGDVIQPHVTDDNLAYVIYTSGSTGRPKGVAVTHRNVVRLVKGNTFADLSEREVLLQFAPVAFDASTFEIWGALLNGARLAVMPPGVPSMEELGEALRRHEVTTLWLTAGFFQLMVDERLEDLKGVRQLLAGGDVLSVAHVRKYLCEAAPGHTLTNGYGPTENTTFTCCHRMRAGDHVASSVPLGCPIANTQVYILDAHMQLVPVGTPGELYAGGDGLARGYLNRPALTAERFVPHPFGVEPGARLYRTGDLARYLAGGQLEFLGRVDQQVKIRGFRIETGEIESVLLRHPQVRECVVAAREDAPGVVRLVAYVVASGDVPTAGALREHLKTKLPDYMVPSAFVSLERLPLTPNGKVDRKALPAPAAPEPVGSYVAPRDELELRLCRIWEDALGVKTVGVKDDFFELGGNSLLAVRLVAQIRKQVGGEVPINVLFQKATVEQLAEALRSRAHSGTLSPLVGIQTSGEQAPLFCVHPIGGTVFCYVELGKRLSEGQPFYGLQAPGVYGEREPLASVEELAAHYLGAVRELQPHGPYRLAGWSMGGVIAFEMAQQLRARGEEVSFLALIDSAVPQPAAQFEDANEEESRLLSTFLSDLASQTGRELADASKTLRRLTPTERLAYLLEQTAAHDLLPRHTDPADLEGLLKVFKENRRALSSYEPRRYSGPLLLFHATQSGEDATAGWRALAEEVKTFAVPGNHYTLMTLPNVEVLAGLLNNELEMAGRSLRTV
jgi:amino acid adenylation domain-containing protein